MVPRSCRRERHLDAGLAPELRENREPGPAVLRVRDEGCLERLPGWRAEGM